MSSKRPPPIPLARLLAIAYRRLIDGLHARLAERGYTDVRPAFGYVLLAVREKPTTGADVAALLGVSKQAASKLVEAMEQGGYLERRAHGDDARAKQLVLTARGRKFLLTVESIYEELEHEWAELTSRKRVEAIRDDLRTILETSNGGVLPPVRPTG